MYYERTSVDIKVLCSSVCVDTRHLTGASSYLIASSTPTITSNRSASGTEVATDSTMRLKRFSENVMAVSLRTAVVVGVVVGGWRCEKVD